MVKKLFALASVTALTGLMAATAASGCSSSTTVNATDDGSTPTSEAGPKDAKAPPTDTGTTDEPAAAVCPTTDPIAASDIEMQFKWMPPAAPQNVCTQKNIDDVRALFVKAGTGGSITFTDIKTATGGAASDCTKCMFTDKTAANWGPIVADGTAGFLQNDFPSCLAQVENAACGKAFFEFDLCLKAACNTTDCGMNQNAIQACETKAGKGACKTLGTAFATACPNAQTQGGMGGVCATFLDAMAVSCSGGPDGGLDASQ